MNLSTTKLRRITQACDFCHRRGLKCRPSTTGNAASTSDPCQTCVEYAQVCTRNRLPKRRGTKPRANPPAPVTSEAPATRGVDNASQPSPLADRRVITALLDVYLDSVHPVFPLYCERELWVGWRDGTLLHDSTDYMSLISMCALSAQHVDNGAIFSHDTTPLDVRDLRQQYLFEAVKLVPVTFDNANLNLVRSYAFLALVGVQNGNNELVHKYLGLYHGLAAQNNLQDESRWPTTLSICDIEMRRRLWWALYRVEVHTACVLGTIIRAPEAQCNVGYPAGLHHPAFMPGRNGAFEDWFLGWNTTTDLFRILEHVLIDFRAEKYRHRSIMSSHTVFKPNLIMDRLSQIQKDLLPQFKSASTRSEDNGRNRCGLQAPNIICTIHLARLLTSISGAGNLQTACQISTDMVNSLSRIPVDYVRAMGSPLVQQLTGMGHILVGAAKQQLLLREDRALAKDVLTSTMNFLDSLGDPSSYITTARERLTARSAELDDTLSVCPGQAAPNLSFSEVNYDDWLPFPFADFPQPVNPQDDSHVESANDYSWMYLKLP